MPSVVGRHRANAAVFDEMFAGSNKIKPIGRPQDCNPSFWVYTTVLTAPGVDRDAVLDRLIAEGIHAGQVHVPNDDLSCFAAYRRDLPGVRSFSSRQISLPCGWWLDEADVRHIAERVLHHIG